MLEDPIRRRVWHSLELPSSIPAEQLHRVVLACAGDLVLRVTEISDSNQRLEVLCTDAGELDLAQAMVHQALADEFLRADIARRSCKDINALVDHILRRAGGG